MDRLDLAVNLGINCNRVQILTVLRDRTFIPMWKLRAMTYTELVYIFGLYEWRVGK